jgi:DNA-binding transcriptional LysR family regulator
MDHRSELRTLVELARLGNARRTADLLGVSQSTVSEAIARLERAYGTRLFDRDRRGSRPTATGALVVDAARRSLELLDNAERQVGQLESYEQGSLSLAAHPCLVESHLVPAITAVLRGGLTLQCRLQSAAPDELVEGLRERRFELFVGLAPDGPCEDMTFEPVGTYRPVPFSRAGHPLAPVPPQGIKALLDYPIVTTDEPLWYGQRRRAGLHLDPALVGELHERRRFVQVTDMATMEAIVTTTDSLGHAPVASIQCGIDDGSLVTLDVPHDEQALLQTAPIVIATMKDRPLPPSAIAVIDGIRSLCDRT